MIEIYNAQDPLDTAKQEKKSFVWIVILSIFFVAGIAVSLYLRIEWLTMALTVLWLSVIIFLFDLKVRPVWRYQRYLRELTEGMQREAEGTVVLLEQDTSLREGVESYRLLINVDPQMDPEGERQFFFDANKPRPQLTPGQQIRLVYHGNDVRAYEITAGASAPEGT